MYASRDVFGPIGHVLATMCPAHLPLKTGDVLSNVGDFISSYLVISSVTVSIVLSIAL